MDDSDRPIVDLSALRIREATFAAGACLTFALGGAGAVYVALTWHRPHRPALAVLLGVALVSGVVLWLLPRGRIVRSRFREHFFLAWSILDLAMIVLAASADGGAGSPLALFFLAPVVFAATTYPLASVAVVANLSVVGFLGVAITVGGQSWDYRGLFTVVLLCAGAMSAWQARNHERQRIELREMSRTDPLTGCMNRRGFEERALAEIDAARREDIRAAVILLDLDDFKSTNDRFGHAAGDELLCWVVATLCSEVRGSDVVGRLGGDEFALLLANVELADASERVAQVVHSLGRRTPCSVGLAMFPTDSLALEGLIRTADFRLYASRHEGRENGSDRLRDLARAAWHGQPGLA